MMGEYERRWQLNANMGMYLTVAKESQLIIQGRLDQSDPLTRIDGTDSLAGGIDKL